MYRSHARTLMAPLGSGNPCRPEAMVIALCNGLHGATGSSFHALCEPVTSRAKRWPGGRKDMTTSLHGEPFARVRVVAASAFVSV
ncbi:hypothetical protein E1H18_1949 [Caulobacter sp. RHG1]|nr:hypothetical protein [Caulobacter sp. RHG1]